MLKTTNSDTSEFLKRNILSCTNYDTHLTMADWLDRLLDREQINLSEYTELKDLNHTLMKTKFENLNIGSRDAEPEVKRV